MTDISDQFQAHQRIQPLQFLGRFKGDNSSFAENKQGRDAKA